MDGFGVISGCSSGAKSTLIGEVDHPRPEPRFESSSLQQQVSNEIDDVAAAVIVNPDLLSRLQLDQQLVLTLVSSIGFLSEGGSRAMEEAVVSARCKGPIAAFSLIKIRKSNGMGRQENKNDAPRRYSSAHYNTKRDNYWIDEA